MSARECCWCGEAMADTAEDVCSPACAEEQSRSDREREMWAEDAARDAKRRSDEADRAARYDRHMAIAKGEES